MSDYRLRGIPPALWRRVRDRAGPDLHAVLIGLLQLYVDGHVDPLAAHTPAQALAARGGHARAEAMSPAHRRASAQQAARARWARARS